MTAYIAHVQTADGEVINALIMAPPEVPEDAIQSAVEQITAEEFPGSTLVGFHEHKPEPKPFPNAIQSMVIQGLGAVALILMLARYLSRKSQ